MLKFLLLTIFATSCIGVNLDAKEDRDLFTVAWEHQDVLRKLQDDINQQLFLVRTSVSEVLRTSTNITLSQIEDNYGKILGLDNVVAQALLKQDTTQYCFQELVDGKMQSLPWLVSHQPINSETMTKQ